MVFPLILVLGHRVWGQIAQFFGARRLDDFGFCTSEYTTIAYSQAKSVNIEAFEFGVKLLRLLTCVD